MALGLDALRKDKDSVRLVVAGEEITNIYQSYNVAASVFEQPVAFNLTLGDGSKVAELRRRFKRDDPFELWIGDTQFSTGKIDGLSFSGPAATATFRGRDRLRALIDGTAVKERSFQNETYFELTRKILDLAGLEDATLLTDNDTARRHFTKIAKTTTKQVISRATQQEQLAAEAGAIASASVLGGGLGAIGAVAAGVASSQVVTEVKRVIRETKKLKIGAGFFSFLSEQYKKVGLFLWCDHQGNFILTEPNPHQVPSYRIARRRGLTRNEVNVVGYSLEDGQPGLHSGILCYGRTGGKKSGRVKCFGQYLDQRALASTLCAFEDESVTSDAEAEFAARRRAAEERRNNFRLSYTLSGHHVLAVNAFTEGIWVPDTVVDVQDDELGIYGPHYIHSVEYQRSVASGTTTTVRLMRPEDMIFSESMEP